MRVNVLSKYHTINLAVTGLMGALVFVATYFFKIEIPVGGDRTMIGFANRQTFYLQFKKKYGMSPSAYRKSLVLKK